MSSIRYCDQWFVHCSVIGMDQKAFVRSDMWRLRRLDHFSWWNPRFQLILRQFSLVFKCLFIPVLLVVFEIGPESRFLRIEDLLVSKITVLRRDEDLTISTEMCRYAGLFPSILVGTWLFFLPRSHDNVEHRCHIGFLMNTGSQGVVKYIYMTTIGCDEKTFLPILCFCNHRYHRWTLILYIPTYVLTKQTKHK